MRKSVRKSNESAFQFIVIARICFAEDGFGIDDSIQRREQQLFAFNEILCCREWRCQMPGLKVTKWQEHGLELKLQFKSS